MMSTRTYIDTTDHSPFMAGGFLVESRPGEKLPRYPVNKKILAKCIKLKVGDRIKHVNGHLSGTVVKICLPPNLVVFNATLNGKVSVSDPSNVYGKFQVRFDNAHPDAFVLGNYLK